MRIHGSPVAWALATVASAPRIDPLVSGRPADGKNDSRLMPRSKPTKPAT